MVAGMFLLVQVQRQAEGCKEVGSQEGSVGWDQFGCHISLPLLSICCRILVGQTHAPRPHGLKCDYPRCMSPSCRFAGFLISQLGVPSGNVLSVSTKTIANFRAAA